jgi:UrcA family protein
LRDAAAAGVLPRIVAVQQFLQTICAPAASNVLDRKDKPCGLAWAYSISEPISSITGDTIMTKSAIYSAAAIVALSLAGTPPAMAEESIVRSIAVSYADLDPSDAQGARLLYARIRWAARKVCTLDDEVGFASQSRAQAQCVKRAVDQAISSVNSPALVAMYRGKQQRTGS